jgi:RHS repeat-associated protein
MKKNLIQNILFAILMMSFTINSFAEIDPPTNTNTATIIGQSVVTVNDTETYTISAPGVAIFSGTWAVIGANVISQNSTSITIKWTMIGTRTLNYTANVFGGTLQTSLPITINASSIASPVALSQNHNYIYTIVPQKAVTNVSQLTQNKDAIKTVEYIDGLGRPKQNVGIQQSASQKDIVEHVQYDNLGRQIKDYLPYASTTSNGAIKTNAASETNSYYLSNYGSDMSASNPNPFAQKAFENSPTNRVLKQASPGYDWRMGGGKEVEFVYQTNTASEVRIYGVSLNSSYTPTLTGGTSYYPAGRLVKTITKDENHTGTNKIRTAEEFKNKLGQVILQRTYVSNGSTADTYYVYDDHGNLTYVLSPKSQPHSAKPDATELSELCYQYKYDKRNRLVEKKIAGKGWEYIVYDKLDRPVLTQDAVLRGQTKWLFTKYDILGRPVYKGIYTHGTSLNQSQMQASFDAAPARTGSKLLYENKTTSEFGSNAQHYYTNNQFPFNNIEVLTVDYYDNYTFNRAGTGTSIPNVYGVATSTNTKGLSTGNKVKVLGTSNWITNVTYYNSKAEPIYKYSKNDYLVSTDIVMSKLDFAGKVLQTYSQHSKSDVNSPSISVVDKFEYDHAGRLIKQKQIIGSQAEEVISENTYDELGKLITKGIGGKTTQNRLQNVDFQYNIRGWLTDINNTNFLGDDLFAFKINYNTVDHSGTKLYNGNISETEWRTKNDNTLRWYRYTYDPLNRIKTAIDNANKYSLSSVSYDKNGNITALQRRGHRNSGATSFGLMDNLQYTYASRSNRLTRVQELMGGSLDYGFKNGSNNPTEYTYDANGNMLRDYNKNMTSNILYNHLNLPTRVTIGGQHISYVYDATGTKLRKIVGGVTTDYAGSYIYEKNGLGAKTLQFFSHSEGYLKNDNGTFKYIYQYKDHLDNIRLTYSDANNNGSVNQSEIIEESNYYPFGLRHKGYNSTVRPNGNSLAQKYTFAGKEHQDELGLNWYDITARNFDPAIGRWMNIDPLSEQYYAYSAYNYTLNSPIKFKDEDGNVVRDPNGNIVFTSSGSSFSTGGDLADRKVHKNGNVTYTIIDRTYEQGNIYADNGTAVEAYSLVSATQRTITLDKTGKVVTDTTTAVDPTKYDCSADCHGKTFGDNKIWINDDQVQTILDNDDNYLNTSVEGLADIVVFKDKTGKIVHSAVRNASGTYDDNAGFLTTQYGRSLKDASRGLTGGILDVADVNNKFKGNVNFYFKGGTDKVLTDKRVNSLGTEKNGVRKITDKKDIAEFLKILSGS